MNNPVDFLSVLAVTCSGMIVSFAWKDWEKFCVFTFLSLVVAIGFVYRLLGGW